MSPVVVQLFSCQAFLIKDNLVKTEKNLSCMLNMLHSCVCSFRDDRKVEFIYQILVLEALWELQILHFIKHNFSQGNIKAKINCWA